MPSPLPAMHWADSSRGRAFAKDPAVIHFDGRYLLYYSICPFADGREGDGWAVGVAESADLLNWRKIGEVLPMQECDRLGLAAPVAWVRDGTVHLFYQTYGNGTKDAICHATSADGIHFTANPTNPIFAPQGPWTIGRAIDAEVCPVGDELFLYFATRDPEMKIQMLGVASAPLHSDFSRHQWTQRCSDAILRPELPWERNCIEAASITRLDGTLWMFYAGGYNNEPQQIGLATSTDGLHWERAALEPFLPNGNEGDWNSSESGHPGVFQDTSGRVFLFYQGNCDQGKTWYLSQVELSWRDGKPAILSSPTN